MLTQESSASDSHSSDGDSVTANATSKDETTANATSKDETGQSTVQ